MRRRRNYSRKKTSDKKEYNIRRKQVEMLADLDERLREGRRQSESDYGPIKIKRHKIDIIEYFPLCYFDIKGIYF